MEKLKTTNAHLYGLVLPLDKTFSKLINISTIRLLLKRTGFSKYFMTYNVDMFWITSSFVKVVFRVIKILHLGSGYTWPGYLVNKTFPNIWDSLDTLFPKGLIFVSGTNGKTTTVKLLAHILAESGFSVTTNASGANLAHGILTSILLSADAKGRISSDFGIFEVDELHLPFLLGKMPPDFLILTNLSRDQLDRYGEIDIILHSWKEAIQKLDKTVLLIPQPISQGLTSQSSANFTEENSFDLEDIARSYKGKILEYSDSPEFLTFTKLLGKFNALNVNSCVLACRELGIPDAQIKSALGSFSPAFGRGEKILAFGKEFSVFLAKNPASFNNNLLVLLEVLSSDPDSFALLFILNDAIPDGRDVSWIYDINSNLLRQVCFGKPVFVAGTRSLDMQIRLSYAGISSQGISFSTSNFLGRQNPWEKIPQQKIVVLPNYSAMLQFRKLVTGRSIL